jgi:hypothetical protein
MGMLNLFTHVHELKRITLTFSTILNIQFAFFQTLFEVLFLEIIASNSMIRVKS